MLIMIVVMMMFMLFMMMMIDLSINFETHIRVIVSYLLEKEKVRVKIYFMLCSGFCLNFYLLDLFFNCILLVFLSISVGEEEGLG